MSLLITSKGSPRKTDIADEGFENGIPYDKDVFNEQG